MSGLGAAQVQLFVHLATGGSSPDRSTSFADTPVPLYQSSHPNLGASPPSCPPPLTLAHSTLTSASSVSQFLRLLISSMHPLTAPWGVLGGKLRLLPLSSLSPTHMHFTHTAQITISIKEPSRTIVEGQSWRLASSGSGNTVPMPPQTHLATTLRRAGLTQTPVSGIAREET